METGKKLSNSRVLYVKSADITGALDISKKIKGRMKGITPISYAEYMDGVAKKYQP